MELLHAAVRKRSAVQTCSRMVSSTRWLLCYGLVWVLELTNFRFAERRRWDDSDSSLLGVSHKCRCDFPLVPICLCHYSDGSLGSRLCHGVFIDSAFTQTSQRSLVCKIGLGLIHMRPCGVSGGLPLTFMQWNLRRNDFIIAPALLKNVVESDATLVSLIILLTFASSYPIDDLQRNIEFQDGVTFSYHSIHAQ